MNNQFDEFTKSLAQSVTRRAALKKFGAGLAGMALACLGLATKAHAAGCAPDGQPCETNRDCCSGWCNVYRRCGCLGRGAICGHGQRSVPSLCLTQCCTHDAFLENGTAF